MASAGFLKYLRPFQQDDFYKYKISFFTLKPAIAIAVGV
jgi:hypothetical protein